MVIENIKAIIRGYLKDIDCIRIYEIREEEKKVMSTQEHYNFKDIKANFEVHKIKFKRVHVCGVVMEESREASLEEECATPLLLKEVVVIENNQEEEAVNINKTLLFI